jgi:hypothetical protein
LCLDGYDDDDDDDGDDGDDGDDASIEFNVWRCDTLMAFDVDVAIMRRRRTTAPP